MSKKQHVQEVSKYTDEDYKFLDKVKKANSLIKENEIAFKMFVEGDQLFHTYFKNKTETRTMVAGLIENYDAYVKFAANIATGKENEDKESIAVQTAAVMKIEALMEKALVLIKSNLATAYSYTTYTAVDGKTPITTKEEWEKEVNYLDEQLKKHTSYNIL